ncbi:unnamed protein product [Lactuca virosa]|uniref:Uncharacterized protein n=1 Tax=Lactuca virosa TaxID=75947 RepID=A0AAU9PCR3_9ASTR|nr:unnamed protein product [Lactuca virosa]
MVEEGRPVVFPMSSFSADSSLIGVVASNHQQKNEGGRRETETGAAALVRRILSSRTPPPAVVFHSCFSLLDQTRIEEPPSISAFAQFLLVLLLLGLIVGAGEGKGGLLVDKRLNRRRL